MEAGDGNDAVPGVIAHVAATTTDNVTDMIKVVDESMEEDEEKLVSTIENVTGGAGGDTLTGDARANTLKGGGGTDTLDGGGGNDKLIRRRRRRHAKRRRRQRHAKRRRRRTTRLTAAQVTILTWRLKPEKGLPRMIMGAWIRFTIR